MTWKRPVSYSVHSGITPWLRYNLKFKVMIVEEKSGKIKVYDRNISYFRQKSKRLRRLNHAKKDQL